MVNHHPKSIILTALRGAVKPLTGETLGKCLGMSRVAVFKHIHSLKEAGYGIISNHAGYTLREYKVLPFTTWEFQPAENVQVLNTVLSTMDEAHARAEENSEDDFVIAALHQTSGRGCRKRVWESPAGGLWATRVIHPAGTAISFQRYVMAAAVGLARYLKETKKLSVRVKWPNDVLVNGKKIAGILGEARILGDRIEYMALGIGVNVNNTVHAHNAATLASLTGQPVDRRLLLRGWITSMDGLLRSSDFLKTGNPRWWNSIMAGRGAPASFITDGKQLTGTVQGADSLGRLRLRRSNGSQISLSAGEVNYAQWTIKE